MNAGKLRHTISKIIRSDISEAVDGGGNDLLQSDVSCVLYICLSAAFAVNVVVGTSVRRVRLAGVPGGIGVPEGFISNVAVEVQTLWVAQAHVRAGIIGLYESTEGRTVVPKVEVVEAGLVSRSLPVNL